MKKFILFILFSLLSISNTMANELNIFKNYAYGMSINEIRNIENIYKCTNEASKEYFCSNNKKNFLGADWYLMFMFDKKDRLYEIIAYTTHNKEAMLKAMSLLSSLNFLNISQRTDSTSFDATKYIVANGIKAEAREEYLNWKKISKGKSKYYFYFMKKDVVLQILKNKKLNDFSEVFLNAKHGEYIIEIVASINTGETMIACLYMCDAIFDK